MSSLLKYVLTAFALVVISLAAAGKSQATPTVLTVTSSAHTASQGATFNFCCSATNLESQPFAIGGIELREPFPALVSPTAGLFVNPTRSLSTESGNTGIFGNAAPGLSTRSMRLAGHFPGERPNEYSKPLPNPIKVGAAVSEPATMILLGTGLLGIATKVRSRRKKRRTQN